MSYILDALRRADAERERKRGAVPSLQSQQHTLVPDDEAPPRSRLLGTAVAVLAVLVIALLAWLFFGDRAPPPAAHTPGDEMAATRPTTTTTPQPMTLSQIAAAPPPVATAPPMPLPGPTATSTTTLTATPSRATARLAPQTAIEEPRPSQRVAAAKTATATAPSASTAESRIVTQAELPDSVRREIPTLAFAGASYSGDAASRMVIINGQVFHEGDTISNGLVLQQIRLRSAVLAYRGYRYEVSY